MCYNDSFKYLASKLVMQINNVINPLLQCSKIQVCQILCQFNLCGVTQYQGHRQCHMTH